MKLRVHDLGNYSCLKVDLIFTRDRAFYFTTVFIPGIILVTSSFITFWLEWNAVPARVMIGESAQQCRAISQKSTDLFRFDVLKPLEVRAGATPRLALARVQRQEKDDLFILRVNPLLYLCVPGCEFVHFILIGKSVKTSLFSLFQYFNRLRSRPFSIYHVCS